METIIKAKSSSGDFYDVIFNLSDGKLTVRCNCKAGIFGKLCKHKLGFLSNDHSLLYDHAEQELLNNAQNWLKDSRFPGLAKKLKEHESIIEKHKKEVDRIKKEIEKALASGL